MRIAFYLPNKNFSNVDCSNPENGNPGIGGTEYMIISIPYYLNKLYRNSHEYILIANSINKLPKSLKAIEVSELSEISLIINKLNIDILVLKYTRENYDILFRNKEQINCVFWAHNFIKRQELTMLAKNQMVRAIICVGSEQLQFYRDHQAFYKSVVIKNGYPIKSFIDNYKKEIIPFSDRKYEVTFMGNLVRYKGFPILAKAWKKIISQIPNAHLNVIGGGTLYDRQSNLGQWGLASEEDEKAFIPYLLDSSGQLLPSVKFWGVLGKEKNDILNITKVGVPNPGGISETFCISALEMQLWGSIVTTIDYGGFIDTVYSTGILYKNVNQLADAVVKQLKKENNDYENALNFMKQFSFEQICKDWLIFFNALSKHTKLDYLLKPSVTNRHRFEEINRKFKLKLPFGKYLPCTMFYKSILRHIIPLKHYV